MDESKNADAFDASAQPATHPANSITSPDSTANNQIISSANLAPPTPLNAPLPTDPLHPTHTVGSGKGDVLVRGGASKRRLLAISGVVLFSVTLIGVAIFALIMTTNRANNPELTLETKFNRYANYLLFGEEKDEKPRGEFDLDTTYEVDRQLKAKNIDENYWQTTRTLLSDTIMGYSGMEKTAAPELGSVLDGYKMTYDFIYLYRQLGDINKSSVIATYLNSGVVAAEEEIANFYGRFSNSELQIAKEYTKQRIAQNSALVKLYEIYNSIGCIQDGEIDEIFCNATPNALLSEEFTTSNMTLAEADARANQILKQAIRSLKDGCWRISDQLQEDLDKASSEDNSEESV